MDSRIQRLAEAGLQNGDVITEYDGYHVDLAKDLYVYMYLNDLNEGDTVSTEGQNEMAETRNDHIYTGCIGKISAWI